jgi:hypothetical protein
VHGSQEAARRAEGN